MSEPSPEARELRRKITEFFAFRTPSFVEAPIRGSEEEWLDITAQQAIDTFTAKLRSEIDDANEWLDKQGAPKVGGNTPYNLRARIMTFTAKAQEEAASWRRVAERLQEQLAHQQPSEQRDWRGTHAQVLHQQLSSAPTTDVEWSVGKGELIAPNGQRFIIGGASHDTDLICRRINESLAQARAPLVELLSECRQVIHHNFDEHELPSLWKRLDALTGTGENVSKQERKHENNNEGRNQK